MIHPLVGQRAPRLALPDQHGTVVDLHALRGTPALVVFVPFAFSGTCTQELVEMRDSGLLGAESGLRVLVVSCDSMFVHRAWAEQYDYPGELLSDFWPHGEAARAYGVFNPHRGLATRGSFLVDADGVVRWAVVNSPEDARPIEGYREALEALAA